MVGDVITYTVTVNNQGPGVATGIQVYDQLPAGVQFVGFSSSTGLYNAATGLWMVNQIAPGATETLEISALVTAAGEITNSAEVKAVS